MQISTNVLRFHLFEGHSNIYFCTHSRSRPSIHFDHRRLQKQEGRAKIQLNTPALSTLAHAFKSNWSEPCSRYKLASMIRHSSGSRQRGDFCMFFMGVLEDWRAPEVEGSVRHSAHCWKCAWQLELPKRHRRNPKLCLAWTLLPKMLIVEMQNNEECSRAGHKRGEKRDVFWGTEGWTFWYHRNHTNI